MFVCVSIWSRTCCFFNVSKQTNSLISIDKAKQQKRTNEHPIPDETNVVLHTHGHIFISCIFFFLFSNLVNIDMCVWLCQRLSKKSQCGMRVCVRALMYVILCVYLCVKEYRWVCVVSNERLFLLFYHIKCIILEIAKVLETSGDLGSWSAAS